MSSRSYSTSCPTKPVGVFPCKRIMLSLVSWMEKLALAPGAFQTTFKTRNPGCTVPPYTVWCALQPSVNVTSIWIGVLVYEFAIKNPLKKCFPVFSGSLGGRENAGASFLCCMRFAVTHSLWLRDRVASSAEGPKCNYPRAVSSSQCLYGNAPSPQRQTCWNFYLCTGFVGLTKP